MGHLKRTARQLLMGSRLPSSWWGPAVLAAAHYSRCAAGLEKWPRLGFGTRAMVVLNPVPRDSFAPRSFPATIFEPSERVQWGVRGVPARQAQGRSERASHRSDTPRTRVCESLTTKLGLSGGTTKNSSL